MIFNKTELFGKPLGDGLEKFITAVLKEALPINAIVVLSLGLGRYCIDYRSVVRAGGRLAGEERYPVDYPYILKAFNNLFLVVGVYQSIQHLF